jgi:hypothetical protein
MPLDTPVAGVGEHPHHPPVLRQYLGDKAGDPSFPSGLGQVLQQQLRDTPAVMGILDEECDFCMVIFGAVIATNRDHVIADGDNECHAIHIIDLGEPLDVAIAQPRIWREEPQVLRLRRDTFIEGDQSVRVCGPDGAQVGDAAVGEQHVSFPLSRVSGRVLINSPRAVAHGHGQSLRNM